MQDIDTPTGTTPEQAVWDKKYGRYARISYIGLGAWLLFNVGSFTWVVLSKIIPFLVIAVSDIPRDDPARIAASHDYGNGLLWLVVIVLVSAGLSLPFRRAVSNAFTSLGGRPSDGSKPSAPKPVSVSWEQVSDDLQIARVGEFEFNVERCSYKTLLKRRRPPYGYRITATFLDHNVYALSPEIFEGMTDEQVRGYLGIAISRQLEAYTNYCSSK